MTQNLVGKYAYSVTNTCTTGPQKIAIHICGESELDCAETISFRRVTVELT
jgi:hypothetical protein